MNAVLPLLLALGAVGADPTHLLSDNETSADARLKHVRSYQDKDFFFTPPPTKEAWEKRRQEVREQILIAEGLWPMPPRPPLTPVIHGAIDRGDYTIEKVFFASRPGHYVTGNLYRPKGKSGKLPGVLFPHGHWKDGRMYEAPDKAVQADLASKGEARAEGARYPLQALPSQLARMGCVVFHYDMVGYADSDAIEHRTGFLDAEAELRLQSFMGLQTWNSVRALDFLLSLPDVDPKRIGVTGASGGGTQTFILCAIDDRPTVAFPAVMVSTDMQGGCICENCSYLRLGTNNVEMAAVFAPKPLAMSGANDWTVDIETRGLPELKALYKLYGAEDKVAARCFKQFGHNYNQVSREMMYGWFNKYLQLGLPEPILEQPFEPLPPKQLSVFDKEHPRPADALDAVRLRAKMTEENEQWLEKLPPHDAAGLAEYHRMLDPVLRVMMADRLPAPADIERTVVGDKETIDGVLLRRFFLSRKQSDERVPALGLRGKEFDGTVVVWIHPEGKASLVKDGKLVPEARRILDRKAAILAIDVFGVAELRGAQPYSVDKAFAGYTFGYNRSLLAERVHDILTAVAYARGFEGVQRVHLLGLESAGPWVLLARGLCGDQVSRTAADADGFRFDKVRRTDDAMMLPGALKYGGLGALAALAAPGELLVHRHAGTGMGRWLKAVYAAAKAEDKLRQESERLPTAEVVDWLLR